MKNIVHGGGWDSEEEAERETRPWLQPTVIVGLIAGLSSLPLLVFGVQRVLVLAIVYPCVLVLTVLLFHIWISQGRRTNSSNDRKEVRSIDPRSNY